MRNMFILVFWIVLALPVSAHADFSAGLRAYRDGAYASAFQSWKVLAEKGDAKAQFNLGLMYKQGNGIKQDLKKALKWYRKSAINGYPRAQYALALRYENGRGVKRHRVNALKWLNLALNKASGKFRVSVAAAHRRVSERLTDAEVEEARHLAEDIKQEG